MDAQPKTWYLQADGRPHLRNLAAALGAALLLMLTVRRSIYAEPAANHPSLHSTHDGKQLAVVTWNVAAINNNPFEYWITPNDDKLGKVYGEMMAAFEQRIEHPGAHDVLVSEVFSHAMFKELTDLMKGAGWDGGAIAAVRKEWEGDYSKRTIIGGFLKDKAIGSKRLVSMPDRYTNTMFVTSHGRTAEMHRPTVINCYVEHMDSLNKWWRQWKRFMFDETVLDDGSGAICARLKKIKRAKYPAISAAEEEISIPLQTLALAIFDAIMVHMMSSVAPKQWQPVRSGMCSSLNRHKTDRVTAILETTYEAADVVFLQETSHRMVEQGRASTLGQRFTYLVSAAKSKRDQNSLIMVRRALFGARPVWKDVSADATKLFPKGLKVPIAMPGDLFAVTIQDTGGNDYLLASFHGDTNGLATLPVLAAVHALASSLPTHRFVFGLDANTYQHAREGWQGVAEFVTSFEAKQLRSCWGDTPDFTMHTTYNARTFVQPQLNKAARSTEKDVKGDKNPKDFILFFRSQFKEAATARDNTGERQFVEDSVFPTLRFPSDHGIVSTELTWRK